MKRQQVKKPQVRRREAEVTEETPAKSSTRSDKMKEELYEAIADLKRLTEQLREDRERLEH